MDNLIAPLEFTDGEASVFIRDNVCAICLGELIAQPSQAEGRTWNVVCVDEGSIMYAHSFVSRGKAEAVTQMRLEVAKDITPPGPKRSPEELIKLLGF